MMRRERSEQRITGRDKATVGAPERARWAKAKIAMVCAISIGGCVQQLDQNASNAGPLEPPPPPESDAGMSTVILPGPREFEFFGSDGIVKSNDPCEATRTQAKAILNKNCGDCHGGRTLGERAGNPPFDFLFDDKKLTSTWTSNTTPPMLFVVPGDPDHSRLYMRARRGEMPPGSQPELPRPTTSDLSVLHQWVSYCLGAKPPPVPTTSSATTGSAGTSGPAAGAGGSGGASTTGGSGGASTTGGSGGASTTGGNGGSGMGDDDAGGSGGSGTGGGIEAGPGPTDAGGNGRDGGRGGGRRGG